MFFFPRNAAAARVYNVYYSRQSTLIRASESRINILDLSSADLYSPARPMIQFKVDEPSMDGRT
jgi:hypothetical protein